MFLFIAQLYCGSAEMTNIISAKIPGIPQGLHLTVKIKIAIIIKLNDTAENKI